MLIAKDGVSFALVIIFDAFVISRNGEMKSINVSDLTRIEMIPRTTEKKVMKPQVDSVFTEASFIEFTSENL